MEKQILNILNNPQNSEDVDILLLNLKNIQNKIINNYKNKPSDEMNKILKNYNDIEKIGKGLYKYKMLNQNNLTEEAKTQAKEVSNLVLKGGISNTRYIWHTEPNACEKCQGLDGKEFEFVSDIPEKPHPNCKCSVENIEDNSDNNEKDEPCDCWQEIETLVQETDEWKNELDSNFEELNIIQEETVNLFTSIRNFKQQVEEAQAELADIEPCGPDCALITGMAANITDDSKLENLIYDLIRYNEEGKQVYQIFLEHKHEMETVKDGLDKYYHAKANCTSAELGEMQKHWAILFSLLKEIKDFIKKVFTTDMTVKEVATDCINDLKADWYGIQKAKEHGYCSEKVRDVYDIFK